MQMQRDKKIRIEYAAWSAAVVCMTAQSRQRPEKLWSPHVAGPDVRGLMGLLAWCGAEELQPAPDVAARAFRGSVGALLS